MMKTFVFGAVALSFASSAFAVDFVDPKTIDPKKWYTIAPTDVNTALLDSCSSRGCFIIHDDATDPMKLKDNGAKWQFPDAKDGSLGKIMNGGNNNCLGVTYDAEHGNALLVTKDSKSCATAKVNDQGQLTIQADQNNFVAKVGEQDDYYGQEAKEEQLSKTAAVLGALEASAPAAGERRRSRVYGNNNVN